MYCRLHGLALPLLEDLVPHIMNSDTVEAANLPDDHKIWSHWLVEVLTAIGSSWHVCASLNEGPTAAPPSLAVCNIAMLVCKLLSAACLRELMVGI